MNVLLLSSRFPWPTFSGDRLRTANWLAALENEATVALVSPRGHVPSDAPRFRFHPVSPSLTRAIAGAMRTVGGVPAHALLAAPYDWADAIQRAREDVGSFDAAIVVLSRLDPWLRALLPKGLRVLDAIDSMSRSMLERSREASPLTRWFWRAESARVLRAEVNIAHAYDRVLVVSPDEAAELAATVISNGVVIKPLVEAPRPIDFAFWGRLAYFANDDAASWLIDEIWPAIRVLHPDATLVIAGAEASRSIRNAHGRNGIEVRSPIDDMAALARQVKVALFPVRHGTGQLTKVMEAAEAGCAIVATGHALRGLEPLSEHALLSSDANELARLAVAACLDHARRAAMASALRESVEGNYSRAQTLRQLASIVGGREAGA